MAGIGDDHGHVAGIDLRIGQRAFDESREHATGTAPACVGRRLDLRLRERRQERDRLAIGRPGQQQAHGPFARHHPLRPRGREQDLFRRPARDGRLAQPTPQARLWPRRPVGGQPRRLLYVPASAPLIEWNP